MNPDLFQRYKSCCEAYLLLKNWRNKVNNVFKRSADNKASTPLSAFKKEMLSSLEDSELLSLNFKLWEYDSAIEREKEKEAEIKAERNAVYLAKCDRIVKSARTAKEKINTAEHLFALDKSDVVGLKTFTNTFFNIAKELAGNGGKGNAAGGSAAAFEQRISAAFRMLYKANGVLAETKLLEKMYCQLGGQGESL
ncbi:MAG: hypothetical protein LBB74_09550 [Chitinispirillales bacterium]|jgi:hypothetical protein|nr:hypothetical protein [Chitinispirillales bacterium]